MFPSVMLLFRARIYNIETHGTAYLLLRLLHRGRLSKRQTKRAIDEMIT